MTSLRAVVTAAALSVAASAGVQAHAQEQPLPDPSLPPELDRDGEPVTLTLEEALRLATEYNPAHRRARSQLELTPADRRDAWLDLLPDPQFQAFSTSMRWNRQALETDFFGDPIEREEQGTVRTSTARQSLWVSFNLDPDDWFDLRRTDRQGEIRELEVEEGRAALRVDVVGAFLDAQELSVAVELEEELLEVEELHLEAVTRQFRLARADRSEMLAAELDVEEQRDRIDEARADRDRALLRLRNLIGVPDLEEIEVEPVDVEVFDPSQVDPHALVAAALDRSPGLRRQDREVAQAREDQRWGRWSLWIPSVDLSFGLSRNNIVRGGDAFFDPTMDRGWDRDFDIRLSLPDPTNYLRTRNQQRRDDVELRTQRETLREEELRVEEELRGGLMDLQRAHQQVRRLEARIELAEEGLRESLESYRLGRISLLELQSASEQAAEARRNALEARYDFQTTRLELERSLGLPLTDILEMDVPAFVEGG